VIEEELEGGGE